MESEIDSKFYKYLEEILLTNYFEWPINTFNELLQNFNHREYSEEVLNSIKEKNFEFKIFSERLIRRSKKSRIIYIVDPLDKPLDKIVFKYLNDEIYNSPHTSSIYKITLKINQYLKKTDVTTLRLDIKNFFDSINQEKLKSVIEREKDELLLGFVDSFLKAQKNSSKINRDYYGIPQGCAISQALSNIYLKELDSIIIKTALEHGDLYFRYTDDFCYLSTNACRINEVENIILGELSKIDLSVNIEKLKKCDSNANFDYLGFSHSSKGIELSNDSLSLIKSNYYKLYNRYVSYSYNLDLLGSHSTKKFWSKLSQIINCSIRGYNKGWAYNFSEEDVYGLARHLSIIQNSRQIIELQKWLCGLNKFYCYKICKEHKLNKSFVELESLINWYYRYKKNYKGTINIAYKRYKENKSLKHGSNENASDAPGNQIIPSVYETPSELCNQLFFENFDMENENYYISIRGHDMIAIDDVYYDDISENWEPIPDDFRIS